MGKQEDIFADGEGDAWFSRNFWKMHDQEENDPVYDMIKHHLPGINGWALEFGCSNGWRLDKLRHEGRIHNGYGIDPSMAAIANGSARFKDIELRRGTMTAHPHGANSMHLLIYGFCLYVSDPEDLFEIVTQANNILLDGGHIIIHDFDPEFPHSVPNKHVEGLVTYKMDWSQLWLSNPAYKLVAKNAMPDGTAVWLLKKDQKGAFPLCSSEFSGSAPSEQGTLAT